jgi:peptidoglycan/LPS O-acetylase OafA/YrhL
MILPNSIDAFAVGMLLALFSARSVKSGWPGPIRALGSRPVLCWALAVALYGGVCLTEQSVLPGDLDQFLHWAAGVWGEVNVIIAFLLLAPAVIAEGRSTAVSRVLNARPVAWIGLVSYGLYLWHVFVLEKVASLFEQDLVPLELAPVMTVVAYALSLAVAAASWYVMERKVLAWAHQRELVRRGRLTSA